MMRNFAVFGLVAGRYFWLARGAAMTLATSENWSLSIVASLSWPPQLPPFPKAYNSGWNEPSGSLVRTDRKSTRLNSSHLGISHAVFCLRKIVRDNFNYGTASSLQVARLSFEHALTR